jgi:hypothetical protein
MRRKLFQFRLRSIFLVALVVALLLFGYGERRRYLREHVFIEVIDSISSVKLDRFEYRYWIITQQSGPEPVSADWTKHDGLGALTIKVPEYCQFGLQARKVGEPEKVSETSRLLSPETSHSLSVDVPSRILRGRPDFGSQTAHRVERFTPSQFESGRYALAGRAVDDRGQPVTKFTLQIADVRSTNSPEFYSFPYATNDGRFQQTSPSRFVAYTIEADGFAPHHVGTIESFDPASLRDIEPESVKPSKQLPLGIGLSFEKPSTSTDREFVMTDGYSLSGTITTTKNHRGSAQVYLMDIRFCKGYEIDISRARTSNDSPKWMDPDFLSTDQRIYRASPSLEGRYRFKHLSPGNYSMLVLYSDQFVSQRLIKLRSEDLELEPIAIPPVGKVTGVLKEWNVSPSPEETTMFSSAKVPNPYASFKLGRTGFPFGKFFRVDHVGRYTVEDVLSGSNSVGSFVHSLHSEALLGDRIDVHAGESNVVPNVYEPILHLQIHDEDRMARKLRNQNLRATIRNQSGDAWNAWLERSRTTIGGRKRRLYCDCNLPKGEYEMESPFGDRGTIRFQFQHTQELAIATKFLSIKKITHDAGPKESNNKFKGQGHVCREGKVLADFDFSSDPVYVVVEPREFCDLYLNRTDLGWAAMKAISFAEDRIELRNIEWKAGGTVALAPPIDELEAFPNTLILRHEASGIQYQHHQSELDGMLQTIVFENIMPGAWLYELHSNDPLDGQRVIFSKRFELEASQLIRFP